MRLDQMWLCEVLLDGRDIREENSTTGLDSRALTLIGSKF